MTTFVPVLPTDPPNPNLFPFPFFIPFPRIDALVPALSRLFLKVGSHALLGHALLQAVSNGSLAGSGGLGEGTRATEGSGTSTVADADDADIVGAADTTVAGHSLGHLDLHGEVGVGGKGQTAEADSGDILGNLSGLEGSCVCAARGAVDVGCEGASAVLVNLKIVCQ